MAVHDPDNKIRIAIVGGGLAGATLMNALMKHAHLDVNIYESGAEFSERGAAVSLARNSQKALSEIGPDTRAALDRAGAVNMNSSRAVIGAGPDYGTTYLEFSHEQKGKVVHRAALLRELLEPVPRERMHTNKKVIQLIDTPDGGIMVRFSDGCQEQFHAVIGADGVHGYVREHILGANHPALKASFAGFWDCRSLVPMERVKEVLGEEYFREARQFGWSGPGGFLLHDWCNNGETVQCAASMVMDDTWSPENWKRELNREKLEQAYSSWGDSPIVKGMITLLLENPDLKAYAQCHHGIDAPTFTKGRACIMGDAAHAMTPWQGAGAGQAIEDTMILNALFGNVQDPNQVNSALRAYDLVRRPRTQKIVASSLGTGHLMFGRDPTVGLDVKKLNAALSSRWEIIHELDMKEHIKEALAIMEG